MLKFGPEREMANVVENDQRVPGDGITAIGPPADMLEIRVALAIEVQEALKKSSAASRRRHERRDSTRRSRVVVQSAQLCLIVRIKLLNPTAECGRLCEPDRFPFAAKHLQLLSDSLRIATGSMDESLVSLRKVDQSLLL